MRDAAVRRKGSVDPLLLAIGEFLHAHALSPDPVHYGFAYAALTDPVMAAAVARLTDGGVRLSKRDIEQLGGRRVAAGGGGGQDTHAADLVQQTQAQVDGFADVMRALQQETAGFGRDLEESAAAIRRRPRLGGGIDDLARITGAMVTRVHQAEVRLATATAETDVLRTKLAEARETARRDTLTGLANRLAFQEAFAQLDPGAGPVCLAVCDIDHFKTLNDRHGHGVGDRVLQAIGSGLAAACDGHLVARHGGEEFAVIMQGTSLNAAADLLDEARASLSERRFRDRQSDTPLGQITMSAGVIALRPREGMDTALARADQLLYIAKAEGRNRVCAR